MSDAVLKLTTNPKFPIIAQSVTVPYDSNNGLIISFVAKCGRFPTNIFAGILSTIKETVAYKIAYNHNRTSKLRDAENSETLFLSLWIKVHVVMA